VIETNIFARTSPAHKLRLVMALQAKELTVSMTGDGVNDAPALKRADVGIAMGQKGTEAAKEASEMVISDDNFASIARAVREGRTVYDNLKKAIAFLLPVNGGESASIILAILVGLSLPIAPLQILWVNMVSSVALAMALAFEASEKDIMKRPPRPASESMISSFLLWRILLVSALFAAGIFGIYGWSQAMGASIEESRTYAVNALVMMEIFYLISVRRLRSSSLSIEGLFGSNKVLIAIGVVVVLQGIFTYAPFMRTFFDTRPVSLGMWGVILGIGVTVLLILELEKWLMGRWRAHLAARAA
jgi:magnesium-transporting ATPase (P-type)